MSGPRTQGGERSQIILLAEKGLSNREIARQLNIDRSTLQRWHQRWLDARDRLAVQLEL